MPNVDYLFYLSELAFAVELALAKAQEEDSVFRMKLLKMYILFFFRILDSAATSIF
jgi:hypothetical protein